MNQFCKKAPLALFAASCLAICGASKAMADTVTLTYNSPGGNSTDGFFTYPYNFSVVDGASTTSAALMCLSFDNEITTGESWKATTSGISGTLEEEAAWLLDNAQLDPANVDGDQLAAWSLFASDVPSSPAETTQLGLAEAFVAANPNDTSFYENFTLYTPVSGTQSTGGTPQIFIGDPTPIPFTATPEPSSLLLLGSGLSGIAAGLYRKRRLV
jgi:PEP-CTERM motif